MLSPTVVSRVSAAALPLIVIVAEPLGAAAVAVSVSVALALPLAAGVTDVGLKLALTPLGKPLALNATGALNPAMLVTVTVSSVLPPGATEADAGNTARLKFGWPPPTLLQLALTLSVKVEPATGTKSA